MSMTQPLLPAHQPFYSAAPTPTAMPFYSPNRKRRAATPPFGETIAEDMAGPSSFPAGSTTPVAAHRGKRRRANLANVLSSMSLGQRSPRGSSPLPSYAESQEMQDEVDEDDLDPPSIPAHDELQVEVLPESSSRRVDRRHEQSLYSSASESSGDESDESIDANIYRRPPGRYRRHAINTQQADAIEQPGTPGEKTDNIDFCVEDLSLPAKRRKRRDYFDGARAMKRRRSDIDMDNGGDEGDYEMRSRKAPTSYEPEKDRIIVTSLSDTESESDSSQRSGSPPSRRDFSQPGSKGFTLSPSLLTHLLATQRNTLKHPFDDPSQEKGLVLYRPLGIPPAPSHHPEIVQQWSPPSDMNIDDSGRFEELDDDEDQGAGHYESGGMDLDMEEPMQLD